MDASGGDIGGDQGRCLAQGEVVEGALSLVLRAVAMDRHCRHAGPGELAGSTVGAMAGAGEHDRAAKGGGDRCAKRNAFRAGKLPEVVGHLVEIGGGFTDLVTHGIGLVGLRELGDLAIECRRIEHGLWVVAGLIEQSLHRRHESHVGHAVGLVDDDVLDLGERHDPLLDQILESAGCCDEHVDAAGESVDLGLKADTSVDGESMASDSSEHRREFVVDLAGEFAGRRQDQDPGAFLAGRAAFERQRNGRNAERQRLSRSGRGSTDDVAPVDQIGDGLSLDREWLRDAGGAQRLDDGRRDTELGERRRAGHPPTVPAARVGVADPHRGGGRRVLQWREATPTGSCRAMRCLFAPGQGSEPARVCDNGPDTAASARELRDVHPLRSVPPRPASGALEDVQTVVCFAGVAETVKTPTSQD